ncbi:hypothetical protein [Pseudonocardia sp. NPDC049154]|uniref:hypothetical protein n=1 Tax=Pseudonocardia sp. NPDC049154 TaxID=3155501 RepID=UPI0033FC30D8
MTVDPSSARPPRESARSLGPGHDVDLIAAAVTSCPLVAGLHPGTYGEVATYLPGRRLPGIRIGTDAIEIHVTAYLAAASMLQVAAHVRTAVAPWAAGRPVDVVIEDLRLPGDEPEPRPPAEAGSAGRPPRPGAAALTESTLPSSRVTGDGDGIEPPAAGPVVPIDPPAGATVTVEVGNTETAATTVITIEPPSPTPTADDGPDRRRARPEHEEPAR